jgi:DNA primase
LFARDGRIVRRVQTDDATAVRIDDHIAEHWQRERDRVRTPIRDREERP